MLKSPLTSVLNTNWCINQDLSLCHAIHKWGFAIKSHTQGYGSNQLLKSCMDIIYVSCNLKIVQSKNYKLFWNIFILIDNFLEAFIKILPVMDTEPFLMESMFGSAASGNKIFVLVLCIIIPRWMLFWPATKLWWFGEITMVTEIGIYFWTLVPP